MKRIMLLCTLVLAVALALPAYAEVQNIKVSGDIRTYGAYRDNFDLSDTGSSDDDSDFFNTSARVRVDADLTDNVSAAVRLLNERDWDVEADQQSESGETSVVIDLANVTLQEFLYSPLTVTIGRQELRYGSGLVVGDVDGNAASRETGLVAQEFSRRKAFDAIRAVLDFDPIVIDSFHAMIDERGTDNEDRTLSGVDVSYDVGDYDANVAGYWVWAHQNEDTTSPTFTPPQLGGNWTSVQPHGMSIHTVGFRGSISPTPALDLGAEVAFQTGDYSQTRDQAAEAFQANASYAFDTQWRPVLRGAFAHFSGEDAASAGDQESWLASFEDQTWGIIADRMQLSTISGSTCSSSTQDCPQSASTNMNIINLGATVEPLDDVTVSLDWYNYTLVEENVDAAGNGNNEVFTTDDEYGDEVDVVVQYDYTEDVVIDGSVAVFSPGLAWESDAQDSTVHVTGGVTVAF